VSEPENPPLFDNALIEPEIIFRYGTAVTLLDYFAGQALAGLLSSDSHQHRNDTKHEQHVAERVYRIADFMLTERQRRMADGE